MNRLWYPERPYDSVRDDPTNRRLYEAYFRVFNRVTQAEHHGPERSGGVVAESLATRT